MTINQPNSHTSNTSKLLKHIDTLKNLQNGKSPVPIMVHVMPTHRCQLNCEHCCFKNRDDMAMDMDLKEFMNGVFQFWKLGTRAMEFTGGGEPVLYPKINYCIDYFHELGMKMGLISNGLALSRIEDQLEKIQWLRISLNTLDYRPETELQPIIDMVKNKTHLSTCYIWNKYSIANLKRIYDFTSKNNLVCRLSPNCIQPPNDVLEEMKIIRREFAKLPENEIMFVSDYEPTVNRRNNNCYIHLIKPAFYTDGYVYPCPSSELAVENDRSINEKFRLCHASEIYNFYKKLNPEKRICNCSYCKYSPQQDLLEDLLMKTSFNDFA